jgi:chorismate-pyruvate lyase
VNTPQPSIPDLQELVSLFYAAPEEMGGCEEVTGDSLPDSYRTLLDHNAHMTVTVEAFHKSLIDVEVLAVNKDDGQYSRKILLKRQVDGKVVQFGIVRLQFDYLSDEVRDEIISQKIPLGRVLIQHNVLREVQLVSLWKIEPGAEILQLFNKQPGDIVYGRTALIYCNGEPAVELLEIVSVDDN